ncbi:MAG: hypothetical protein M3537_11050 [Chloroflexota bacterium]|nr:hypothetical protein [Chloroflexota bacterium]
MSGLRELARQLRSLLAVVWKLGGPFGIVVYRLAEREFLYSHTTPDMFELAEVAVVDGERWFVTNVVHSPYGTAYRGVPKR